MKERNEVYSLCYQSKVGPAKWLEPGTNKKIKELAEKIAELTGFTGEIRWDSSKPDGQPRRRLEVSKAKKYFGFEAKTSFDEGLKAAIAWYKENRTRFAHS